LTQSQSVTIFKNWDEHGWTKEQTTTTRTKSLRHTKLLLGSRNRPPVNTVLQGADGYSIWQWKGIQRGWLRLQPKRLLSEFKPLYASPQKSQTRVRKRDRVRGWLGKTLGFEAADTPANRKEWEEYERGEVRKERDIRVPENFNEGAADEELLDLDEEGAFDGGRRRTRRRRRNKKRRRRRTRRNKKRRRKRRKTRKRRGGQRRRRTHHSRRKKSRRGGRWTQLVPRFLLPEDNDDDDADLYEQPGLLAQAGEWLGLQPAAGSAGFGGDPNVPPPQPPPGWTPSY